MLTSFIVDPDLGNLILTEAIVVLTGVENSKGCRTEALGSAGRGREAAAVFTPSRGAILVHACRLSEYGTRCSNQSISPRFGFSTADPFVHFRVELHRSGTAIVAVDVIVRRGCGAHPPIVDLRAIVDRRSDASCRSCHLCFKL